MGRGFLQELISQNRLRNLGQKPPVPQPELEGERGKEEEIKEER